MIYEAGERVSFIPLTSESPETAVFELSDERGELVILPLTVANGGLVPKRKGALHPVFNAPAVAGRYSYRFWDVSQEKGGSIRVTDSSSATGSPDGADRADQARRTGRRWRV